MGKGHTTLQEENRRREVMVEEEEEGGGGARCSIALMIYCTGFLEVNGSAEMTRWKRRDV